MKKKNKAFTLIELLAVIVILAIIAVITVPIITGIIDNAEKESFKDTAYGIIESANIYYAQEALKENTPSLTTFTVNNNRLVSGEKELAFTGKSPIGDSWVKINNEGRVSLRITDGTYYVSKDYDETGVVLAENEEEALTREELASELAELRNIVNNNNIELADSINELTNKENANNIFLKTYPVGSIYISTNSANPSTLYGGTWITYGEGRTIIGVGDNGTTNYSNGSIGGNEIHTHNYTSIETISNYRGNSGGTVLTIEKMPEHNHHKLYMSGGVTDITNISYNSGTIGYKISWTGQRSLTSGAGSGDGAFWTGYTGLSEAHDHTINHSHTFIGSESSTENSSNLQPYIVTYMWKRID